MDPIAQLKENAKKTWSTFTPIEMATSSVAPVLVRFAGIRSAAKVLDVACGTGVVALTAARLGAQVHGIDITPELVVRAKENAEIMRLAVDFREGDAESLPFPDATFDVVVSQFGHMFAPRAEVVTAEMLRVLKPGGTIAFSTWPPDVFVGQFFSLLGRYAPPPPPGTTAPPSWGEPAVVRERLGAAVRDLTFDRHRMYIQMLSVQHQRLFFERNVGPLGGLVRALEGSDPGRLETLRTEIEALIARYFEDNHVRQDFLLSRAAKI